MSVEGDEIAEGQQGCRAAADGVEERHQLRHGGHGDGPGHPQAQAPAERQAGDDDRPVAEPHPILSDEDDLGRDGDDHAHGRQAIAGPSGRGRVHEMQAYDEESRPDDEGELYQVADVGGVHRDPLVTARPCRCLEPAAV